MAGRILGTMSMRRCARGLVAAAFLLLAFAAGALAADESLQAVRERLTSIRTQFEFLEGELGKSDRRTGSLVALREQVEPLRAELQKIITELEPRLAEAEARLKQLGPPPAAILPPEAPEIATEREQQSTLSRELDGALKQARTLSVQGGQLAERIDRQRRSAFTARLFAQAASVFDPALWIQAAAAIPAEAASLGAVLGAWGDHLADAVANGNGTLALLLALTAVVGIYLLRELVRRYSQDWPREPGAPALPRPQVTWLAFRDAVFAGVTAPAASLAAFQILAAFGLLPDRVRPLVLGLVTSIIFVAVGRALARAVLAPQDASRRLPALHDRAAVRLYRLVVDSVVITAAVVLINIVHRALTTELPLTIATNALYALIIAGLIVYALLARSGASEDRPEHGIPPWVRLLGWTSVATIGVALIAGYVRFASFVAERVVTAAVVILGLYLLLALVDAVLGQGLSTDNPRRRAIASTLGIRVRTLDLLSTLFAGVVRTLLVLTAIFVVVGTITASVIDVGAPFDRATLGVELGGFELRLSDILTAIVIVAIGLGVTRILHNWLSRSVLPRTSMEASLQNSIATIVGYAGVIIAVSLGLARLGVNLENIALVAGALSIGIGFGLQAIVSNFVSGLILLTERPIRVGDWIVVGNEQGHVRRISVRSTEIETFDRASVIVPNSDLITSTVKNWTHADYLGRLELPVGVSYDSDPEQVREVLLAAAAAHPQVLKDPAPYVLFMKFGDSALEFELRGVVANVNQRLSVLSDLHFDIFKRMREAGIEIPFPQRDVHIRSAPPAGEPPGKQPSKET